MQQERENGFTIIEMTIGAVLMTVGLAGFFGALASAEIMGRKTSALHRANAVLVTTMEEYRGQVVRDFERAIRAYGEITRFTRAVGTGPNGEEQVFDTLETQSRSQLPERRPGTAFVATPPPAPSGSGAAAEALAEALTPSSLIQSAYSDLVKSGSKAETEEESLVRSLLSGFSTSNLTAVTPQLIPPEQLFVMLAVDVINEEITIPEAIQIWNENGDGTPFVMPGTDPAPTTVASSEGAGATAGTEPSTPGTSTTTTQIATASPTQVSTSNWQFSPTESRVVTTSTNLAGEQITTVSVAVEEGTAIAGIVDFDLLNSVGPGAEIECRMIHDETQTNPPVDLNGDGDTMDTMVLPGELRAAILQVTVRWLDANGVQSIETTTIVARGELEAGK